MARKNYSFEKRQRELAKKKKKEEKQARKQAKGALQTVFVAGYQNSQHGHWQLLWFQGSENGHWVEQTDWDNPDRDTWVQALDDVIQAQEEPVLIVAHSIGCNTVVEWSRDHSADIAGVFFVAVPDVAAGTLPDAIHGFEAPAEERLPFPGMVVASSDDPYASLDRARELADAWGCQFVSIGDRGHINADSGIGGWADGKFMLENFVATL